MGILLTSSSTVGMGLVYLSDPSSLRTFTNFMRMVFFSLPPDYSVILRDWIRL